MQRLAMAPDRLRKKARRQKGAADQPAPHDPEHGHPGRDAKAVPVQGREGDDVGEPGLDPRQRAREVRLHDVDGDRERGQPGDAGVFFCDFEFHRLFAVSGQRSGVNN
jgi:hypothetical protein